MITFPNAKINLGLRVVGKRSDGFHEIETVFYPIRLCDALEIIEAPDSRFGFETTGLQITGDPDKNLCILALNLLASGIRNPESNIEHRVSSIEYRTSGIEYRASDIGHLPLRIHLHKIIPPGSGLGGGSSDGAFTIKLLNDHFSLGLSAQKMEELAGILGSDCPFFIRNKPMYAFGRGDRFETATVDLMGYTLLVVVPQIHVSTQEAYQMIDEKRKPHVTNARRQPALKLKEIVNLPVGEWENKLVNDFEKPVFEKYPEIQKIKENLYSAGALYASMSGSGSSVYGIFLKKEPELSAFRDYFIWSEMM